MKPWHPRLAQLPPLTPRDLELRDRLASVCHHLGLHTFPRFAYPEAYVEILEGHVERRHREAREIIEMQQTWADVQQTAEDEETEEDAEDIQCPA